MTSTNKYKLEGKKILITGANGQLGSTFVLELLKNGAFVFISDIADKLDGEMEVRLQRARFNEYCYVQMDVTSFESVMNVEKNIEDGIDILINNAGVAVFTPFEDRTPEELDFVIDVNLKGALFCTQFFSRRMIQKKRGKILNIGSIYGVVSPDERIYGDSGRNSSEIYGATKAAIIQLTKYFAAHLAKYNIIVNCISPGGVYNRQSEFFFEKYSSKAPLGRMATAEDIAGPLCFLCTDDSNYITGHNLIIDGGFSTW